MPKPASMFTGRELMGAGRRYLMLFLAVAGLVLIMSSSEVFAAQDVEKTAAICAKADARYAELFPEAKPEKGVTVIKMLKYTFCPPNAVVKAGETVRWVNVEKRTSHSVWFRDRGEAESERLFPEEMVEMTFYGPGEFGYLCGPHWEQEDMIGSLTVIK